jgi:hypothetical protein
MCQVNDGATCTPTAEAEAGLFLPANGSNDKAIPGLKCVVHTNPGVTVARAVAKIDDYVLLQTEAGVPQPGFAASKDVIVIPPTPTPTP